MAQQIKQVFELFPWQGGYNPSLDPIILNPQQLQIGENITFDTNGGRKKRGGIGYANTAVITVGGTAVDLMWGTDYWANVSSAKRAYHVIISEGGTALRSPYNGIYSSFNSAATATLSITQGQITSEVMNEDLIIGYSKSAPPKVWDGQNTSTNLVAATAASGTYPNGWIVRAHRNRLWVAGSSSNPDRIYYSGFTAGAPDHRAWNTASSAGYIDLFPGDGDPEGITAIFPEINQGGLYVAKRTKIYFINTSSSDDANWTIALVSNGIGCVSHNSAVAVDQTDVIFASDRGIHSLGQVINQAGIIESAFLSADIHTDYQNVLVTADRNKYNAVWYPRLNSYFLAVSQTAGTLNRLYAYNIELKQWYVWKPADGTTNTFNFLHLRFNGTDKDVEFYGTSDKGRVLKFDQSVYYDLTGTSTLTQVAVSLRIKSAAIYPAQLRTLECHFTDLAFYVDSKNTSSFSVLWTIDNANTQSKSINQVTVGGNILGTTILGTLYILGESRSIKPYLASINGVGNAIEIEIQHNDPSDFRLYGIACKYIQSNESYNPRRNLSFGS